MSLVESAGGTGTWPTNAGAVTTGTITPASGDLLVAIAVCGNGSNNAATSIAMSGTGAMSGTWTLKAHLYLTTGPMAAIFMKDAGASPASGTATATFSSPTEGSGLIVRRFAGALATASQTGVTQTAGSAGGGVYTIATGTGLTTGSIVVGGFADSSNSITLTANGNTTIYNKSNGSGGDTEAAFEASSASTSGTSVTLGFTNTGSDSTALVLVEVLPASGTSVSAGLASGSGAALNAAAQSNSTSAAAGLASGTGAALAATALITLPPFPQTPLDLQCDLNLSGSAWTRILASLAYQRDGTSPPVSITRGKPDESASVNPAACSWQWNNRDGRFSPRNPNSIYYGQLNRNTPVRWSVPAQSNYLRLEGNAQDRAFTGAPVNVTGSIDLQLSLRLTDWQGGILAHKWDGGACWYWYLGAGGTMQFAWNDGTTTWNAATTVPLPYAGGNFALRVAMNASTGTVTFYTGTTLGSWTQLGSAVSPTGGASTSIATSGVSVPTVGYGGAVAPGQVFGRIYEFRLYNGISGSGGTLAADAVFSAQAAGTTSWSDAQGNTWNLAGLAEISSRNYRFHGEMSSQPPKWDVTGNDQWVAAAAGGPQRRLTQGTANVMSAMKRAIISQAGSLYPVAYWSLEDGAGASQFGADIGGLAATWTGGPPDLASDSSLASSGPLPQLGTAVISASAPSYSAGGTAWTVRFALKRGTPPGSQSRLLAIAATGAVTLLEVLVDTSGAVGLAGFNAAGTQVIATGGAAFPELPGPAYWSVEATPSGGSTLYALVAVAPGASAGHAISATVAGAAGNVLSWQLNGDAALTDSVVGQVQVQSAWASLFTLGSPLNAWIGETAAARYARLAGENGYQCRILGSPAVSAAMGAQTIATLGTLLGECEQADLGQQFEPRQALALGYRTLASMLSQSPAVTLDYSQSQPGGVSGDDSDSGLDPTYDDQLLANNYTVTRGSASGSQGATVQVQLNDGSAMSVSNPPTGIGAYAKTATVNTEYDTQLQDVAGWLVHTGTVNEARWPAVPVNLARTEIQTASLYYPVLDAEVGDYVELVNLPGVITSDPVRQVCLGMSEQLGGFHHTLTWNCVPESPYEVVVLDDPVYGRVDTDGSTLASSATPGATTLSVATANAASPLWTTSSSDFPFDIAIAGERITVTNITGSSSPQSFTVTRSVNGVVKAQASGADVRLWFPPVLAIA